MENFKNLMIASKMDTMPQSHYKKTQSDSKIWSPLLTYPENLPISSRKDEWVTYIRDFPTLIIVGETGSGKTTQLPKLCLEAGLGRKGKIACTQPRRVAAYSVAERIAEELKVPLGQEVGCQVRFDDRTSSATRIQVMTDGILLAQIQKDPLLKAYEAIIIDEAHERSLNIDFLIGYLRQIRPQRPDLKILLTSATLDTTRFSEAFQDAKLIIIEGRSYPVELIYSPLEKNEEASLTYIEAASEAIQFICAESIGGDILVFLPGEKDIRELSSMLEDLSLGSVAILPLFGRLSRGEQHRIFEKTQERKIILATNIAETSITLPGIRYVVDTGLVRMSRYSPHTRTKRLPIEPISQGSAKQRQGRAGRVAEGVCIRLYDEQEFSTRSRYTEPEIRRSNLAEVILKMIAFGLGDIEVFPFIDPPEERAIRAGYKLLKELGALDAMGKLTRIGEQLARLPIDPTVGRMLLQARQEHALNELLIIASALSIQDPRERPFEKEALAEASHKRFVHPESDFLTLLNIWNAYHDTCESMKQSALRRFCKDHYLSYTRMREWRDVYQQLLLALKDLKLFRESTLKADYRAIHRSLLVGLLGHVAEKEKGNHYKAVHNRKVMLFPGSSLFDRGDKKQAMSLGKLRNSDTSKTPHWIMCGEWVETSQLFARTVAKIDPEWVIDLAGHLIKRNYGEAFWDAKKGRVLAREKLYLHGLLLQTRSVGYSQIDPEKATEIFIREALVADDIREKFPFLENNRRFIEAVEIQQAKLRVNNHWEMEERLFQFYAARIDKISSVAELFKRIRTKGEGDLYLSYEDLVDPHSFERNEKAYPSAIILGGKTQELQYQYNPGHAEDGATLTLDLEAFQEMKAEMLDWLIPGHIEPHIIELLKALPKELRRRLFPIVDTAKAIAKTLDPSSHSLKEALALHLKEHYHCLVDPLFWDSQTVSLHLRPRLVVQVKDQMLAASRCFHELQQSVKTEIKKVEGQLTLSDKGQKIWEEARLLFEKIDLKVWDFGDLPPCYPIGKINGVEIIAYPGLCKIGEQIALKLFESEFEAQSRSVEAYRYFLYRSLSEALRDFQKDLSVLQRIMPQYIALGSMTELKESVYSSIEQHFIQILVPWPLSEQSFNRHVQETRMALRGLALRIQDLLIKILSLWQELSLKMKLPQDLLLELQQKVYPGFLSHVPFSIWQHMDRYLMALKIRAQRRELNPSKDVQKAQILAPWTQRYRNAQEAQLSPLQKRAFERYAFLLEEYRVSLFAQELGTATSVSEKKLGEAWKDLGL